MKDNKFFELFNDIDSKFIHEAEEKVYEESTAEAVTTQLVPKRKIYPAVLKTAACLAAVGVAAGGFIAIGHGTPSMLSPNSFGELVPEASDTSDISDTTEPPAESSSDNGDIPGDSSDITDAPETSPYNTDISQDTTISESAPAAETADPTLKEYGGAETGYLEEETQREAAVKEWNSREFASPVGELPISEGYSANVDWVKVGFKSLFIPVENPNTEVRAVSDGEIVYIGYIDPHNSCSSGGNVVLIKHNDYVYTDYCGIVENESLKVGDMVTAGQVIGHVDDSIVYFFDSGSCADAVGSIDHPGNFDITSKFGFVFELRTPPANETDIGKIMGTVIGDNGTESRSDEYPKMNFIFKENITVTDNGECIGTAEDSRWLSDPLEGELVESVREAKKVSELSEEDFKV